MNDNKNLRANDQNENADSKTELANKIAKQSKKVAHTYEHIEDASMRALRWFSSFIDKVLFNRRYGKIVALVLAVLMYALVNYDSGSTVYSSGLNYSKNVSDVAVTAKYNTDTFELSGLPTSADITITGDANNVTSSANSKGTVVANLEGLTEGTHTVTLTAEGYGSSVDVKINPSTAVITLKKKTTQQFDLSYDFINQDKMESIYSLGTPQFEYTKVNVRASSDTLNTIAFVKALIDVSGQTADFTLDAKLMAYDSSGQPVAADIVPSTVSVTVPVTSPNKTVPIEVEVSGVVPDNQAIAGITMDQQTVTIYGPESVLGQIENVVVTLDASTITKDSTILRPIALPTGVNSSNINQITINVTLGERVSKTIEGVKIQYKNNTKNYKASQPNNQTTTSVTVYGTQENVDAVTADNITVYVDMKDAVPGLQEFPLQVDQPSNGLVTYELTQSTYQLNVLGETTDDTASEESNNG